jgi:hypothetical protein
VQMRKQSAQKKIVRTRSLSFTPSLSRSSFSLFIVTSDRPKAPPSAPPCAPLVALPCAMLLRLRAPAPPRAPLVVRIVQRSPHAPPHLTRRPTSRVVASSSESNNVKCRLQLTLNVPTGETSLTFGDRVLEDDLCDISPLSKDG